MTNKKQQFTSFKAFYSYYLSEHQHPICRRLHYLGSTLVLLLLAYVLITQTWLLLLALPIVGYGCAWLGHYFFERNKPATFSHPLYSFLADWVMFRDALVKTIQKLVAKT